MTKPVFSKPFTQQEAIPEAGIARAVEIMKTGRLHRYNLLPDEAGEAAALEMEYAKWQGADYCISCTSGGYAIQLGLRVCGVKPGDKVLANAYTLAPVPGAIHNVGGVPVLVDIDESYHIDVMILMPRRRQVEQNICCYLICGVIFPIWTSCWRSVPNMISA